MKQGSTLTYLHSDHLGSTVLETDTSGNPTADQKYRAYGNQRDTGAVVTDHKFTGQKLDGTGLQYYNARYYDPAMGVFISPDTVVPDPTNVFGYNRYMYGLGNPVRNVDPNGHDPIDTTWQTEFEQAHHRVPTAEDVLIRLYSVAFPAQWDWSTFYNADGSYKDGSIHTIFENTNLRSWADIPDALSSMSGWYTSEEGEMLTRDIGTLFGGLLNRLEQPNAWATISFPSNPARVWVRVGSTGLSPSLIGNNEDGNIHHWGWTVAIGGSWFHASGEAINSGREISQLSADQIIDPPADFYADVAIGNAGVVFGRRVSQNGPANIRQDFQETMAYWANYFQQGGGQ